MFHFRSLWILELRARVKGNKSFVLSSFLGLFGDRGNRWLIDRVLHSRSGCVLGLVLDV